MVNLLIIAQIGFVVWIVRNTLFWVSLWQRKEYRIDRVLVHLRDTYQGRHLLLSTLSMVKWLLIIVYILFVVYDISLVFFNLAVLSVYVFEAFRAIQQIFKRTLRRPIPTPKALLLVALPIFAILSLQNIAVVDTLLWLLLLDRLLPVTVFCFVLLFAVPTDIYRDIRIQKAMQLIKKHKTLIVIGVTGSFGKSSTKEYIAQILQHKFSVLKTKESQNTPIGIASAILSGLKNETQVFVVEMGAYKKGEIAALCAIVRPTIGVLTALNDQHVALFGSFQKIMDTKFELIDALPHNGTALFNATQPEVYELSKRSRRKHTVLYAVKQEGITLIVPDSEIGLLATDVSSSKTKVSFVVHAQQTREHFSSPLIGVHNTENILPGIYIALMLGMTLSEIKKAVSQLSQPKKTMQRKVLPNGLTIIDDTFNVNPEGILAGVSYLSLYKGKKALVLESMIELGSGAAKRHEAVGREIGKVCDVVFLTNRNFAKQIKKGIGNSKCKVYVKDFSAFFAYAKQMGEKDAILFEGKESAMYIKHLL